MVRTGKVRPGLLVQVSSVYLSAIYQELLNRLTSINPDISRSGIGDRSETSWISTSQIGSIRKTIVLSGGIEISFELLWCPVSLALDPIEGWR
jgi:hypothetical protein